MQFVCIGNVITQQSYGGQWSKLYFKRWW